MKSVIQHKDFKRDIKRLARGKYRNIIEFELSAVIMKLANDEPLGYSYHDHLLTGKLSGFRECHLAFDLVMIYKLEDENNTLATIKSRGSITGVVSTFMMLGIIGVVLFMSFLISLFLQNRSRFGLALTATILFDYIFYNASIVNVMALFTLTIFLCLYPTESTETEFD